MDRRRVGRVSRKLVHSVDQLESARGALVEPCGGGTRMV